MASLPRFFAISLRGLMFSLVCGWASWACAHGDYHEVVAEIESALKKEPENSELHFRLAVACEEHGEWSSALVALERAERLAPGKHPVALVQGLALAKGGQYQAAEAVLGEFITAHPHHAKALTERARVKLKLKRPDEAIRDFQTVLKTAREPEMEVFLEIAALWVSQGNRAEAAKVLNDGIARLGPHPELLERALEMAVAEGQTEVAMGHLEALKQTSPQPQAWLAQKAKLLAQAGRREEAQTMWRELRDHLLALPNLERGQPHLNRLLEEAHTALGEPPVPAVVNAPPAEAKRPFATP